MCCIGETLLLLLCLPLSPPTTQHHRAHHKGSIIPVAEEKDFFYFLAPSPVYPEEKEGEKNFGGGEGEEINTAKSRAMKNFFFFLPGVNLYILRLFLKYI